MDGAGGLSPREEWQRLAAILTINRKNLFLYFIKNTFLFLCFLSKTKFYFALACYQDYILQMYISVFLQMCEA
jgi:hypothetical protein